MDTDTITNLAQIQHVLHPEIDHDEFVQIYQECAEELGFPTDPEHELTSDQADALYNLAEDAV